MKGAGGGSFCCLWVSSLLAKSQSSLCVCVECQLQALGSGQRHLSCHLCVGAGNDMRANVRVRRAELEAGGGVAITQTNRQKKNEDEFIDIKRSEAKRVQCGRLSQSESTKGEAMRAGASVCQEELQPGPGSWRLRAGAVKAYTQQKESQEYFA